MSAKASLGAVPVGWTTAQVWEVGEVQLGRQRSPEHHTGKHMRPYLRVANVHEDRIDTSDVLEMNFTPEEFKRYALRHGDILLNEGQSLELVGRAAMYRDEVPGACFQNTLLRYRVGPSLDSRFTLLQFLWFLHSQRFKKIASWTTSIAHLGSTRFAAMELALPPKAEQHRIVDEVEKQFTRLDAAVAGLQRVKANLKRYRASVLKAACEGRLVPTEAEVALREGRSFESGEELLKRILKERRARWEADQLAKMKAAGKVPRDDSWKAKYKEPLKPDVALPNPRPDGWATATWSQVGFSQNGRPFPSGEYQASGVKLVRPGNLHVSGRVEWSEKNTAHLNPRWATSDADLLIGPSELIMNLTAQSLRDEFLGRICLTVEGERCLLNQRLARLTPVLLEPRFVLWWLKTPVFRRFVDGLNTGSLIQHMFTSQLDRFVAPLPPLAEQHRIVAEVERRLSVVDELEATVEKNLARCARLRQSILKMAFEGRLVPQDPNDEPASDRLERIRRGREAAEPRARKVSRVPRP